VSLLERVTLDLSGRGGAESPSGLDPDRQTWFRRPAWCCVDGDRGLLSPCAASAFLQADGRSCTPRQPTNLSACDPANGYSRCSRSRRQLDTIQHQGVRSSARVDGCQANAWAGPINASERPRRCEACRREKPWMQPESAALAARERPLAFEEHHSRGNLRGRDRASSLRLHGAQFPPPAPWGEDRVEGGGRTGIARE
jgi:hypothetical protein